MYTPLVLISDTPYFSGDAYSLVPYSPTLSNTSLVQLSFQTLSSTGLILYTSDEDHSSYLSLGLEQGLLSLRLKQEGILVVTIATFHPVSDGRWHSVSVFQNELDLILDVDGYCNGTQLVDMSLVMQPAMTYVGGYNNFSALPSDVRQSSGLVGLLAVTIELGGEVVHIVNDSIAGKNIEDRFPGVCGPATCTNGGLCVESGDSYTCLCPLGYRGNRCEQGKLLFISI